MRIVGGVSRSDGGRWGSKPLPAGRSGIAAAAGAAPCVYQAGGV